MTEQNDTGDTPPEDTLMHGGPTSGNPEQADPAEESSTPDMTPSPHNSGDILAIILVFRCIRFWP